MEAFDDQTKLIRAILAETQADAQGAWTGFLSLLRQVTQAEGASLVLDSPRKICSWFDGSPDNSDPSKWQKLRFDRVYSHENLPPCKGGAALIRIIKVRATNDANLTLSITRGTHDSDFRSADGQMLHKLAPFLGQVMALWLDGQRKRAEAKISEAMLAALGGCWLVLDTTGKVKRSSLDMVTDFQAAEGLPLKFGKPAISSAFTEAFAKAVAGEEPVAFSLDQGEMLLTQIEYENAPAVLGRLRIASKCALISAKRFAHHFGVSTSEARLAILICDGHSLKAAAPMLGWTEETTRTYSKSLFACMGVSGQQDLVRRILNSSIWYKA